MNERERCPNRCGETMMRVEEQLTLQYSGNGYRSDAQTHMAYYRCRRCMRTYVSSVFKRFKEKNIV